MSDHVATERVGADGLSGRAPETILLDVHVEQGRQEMKKKIVGAVLAGVAGAALIAIGTGTANADPTCLIESAQGAVANPAAALTGTLSDPAGAVKADAACAQAVLTP
ncbi:hypothetical protein ACFPFQ_11525 [Pseudonocardia sp. GCM10023141]